MPLRKKLLLDVASGTTRVLSIFVSLILIFIAPLFVIYSYYQENLVVATWVFIIGDLITLIFSIASFFEPKKFVYVIYSAVATGFLVVIVIFLSGIINTIRAGM